MAQTIGFVMELPAGTWLCIAPGGDDGGHGVQRVLRAAPSLAAAETMAPRFGLPIVLLVEVAQAIRWEKPSPPTPTPRR